jgi:hypothetical protein
LQASLRARSYFGDVGSLALIGTGHVDVETLNQAQEIVSHRATVMA